MIVEYVLPFIKAHGESRECEHANSWKHASVPGFEISVAECFSSKTGERETLLDIWKAGGLKIFSVRWNTDYRDMTLVNFAPRDWDYDLINALDHVV